MSQNCWNVSRWLVRTHASSRGRVFQCFTEFRREILSVKDAERSGWPSTAVTEENTVRLEKLICLNRMAE